jgi:prepilin-type N-terminal cleavage/methylation domain-containing protein
MDLSRAAGINDLSASNLKSSAQVQLGLTLTELVFAIALIAILAAVAVPSLQDLLGQHRVKAAANTLSQDLRFGREESVRLGRNVHINFQGAPDWCWGLRFDKPCDCSGTTPGARCDISRAKSSDFKGVTLVHGQNTWFEHEQGRVAQPGATELLSTGGHRIRVELLANGRVHLCSVAQALTGIEPC